MTAVEVDRLTLRCDPVRREPARFALEDALRTELPDDDRLVLLRRLRVAPAGSSAHPGWRQAAMREAWAAATGGARHGGEDGAGEANCVWFASEAEAERLLLARLLRGRGAGGWFWKLALPRWRGLAVRDWLPELLAEAGAPGEEPRLLALVEVCVAAGAEHVLVEALERAAPRIAAGPFSAGLAPSGPMFLDAGRPVASPAELPRQTAASVLTSFSPPVRALLRRLASIQRALPALRAILTAQSLRHSPALSLAPAVLERTVDEAVRVLTDALSVPGPVRRADGPTKLPETRYSPAPKQSGAARETSPGAGAPGRAPQELRGRPEKSSTLLRPAAQVAEQSAAETTVRRPVHSAHAGLWLAVPALGDMGLRAWLASHPDRLGDHPGGQLILAIARHHRVPPDDPALAMLGELDAGAPVPEWVSWWRHGLDRWLRRRARRRLHDLVNRPGRVDWSEQRLDVTYPPAHADIRLRRLALDRDPGWTDWLGLSIRYHFREPGER